LMLPHRRIRVSLHQYPFRPYRQSSLLNKDLICIHKSSTNRYRFAFQSEYCHWLVSRSA